MPFDIRTHVRPDQWAVVNMECQEGLLGPDPLLPSLARAAAVGLVPNLARLFAAARSAGAWVYYCIDERRPNGFGLAGNTLVYLRSAPGRRPPAALAPSSGRYDPSPRTSSSGASMGSQGSTPPNSSRTCGTPGSAPWS